MHLHFLLLLNLVFYLKSLALRKTQIQLSTLSITCRSSVFWTFWQGICLPLEKRLGVIGGSPFHVFPPITILLGHTSCHARNPCLRPLRAHKYARRWGHAAILAALSNVSKVSDVASWGSLHKGNVDMPIPISLALRMALNNHFLLSTYQANNVWWVL